MTLEELIIKIRADAKGVHETLDKTKGDIKGVEDQATKSKKGLSGVFSGVGVGGAAAAAGLATGFAIAAKSVNTYKGYLKEVKAMQRATNATAEEASTIVGQMKLIGGEDLNTADALGRWAVNLAAARDAGSAQAKIMDRLGIELKTQTGEWRTGADVLMEYREKMAHVEDATQRAADLQAMMGRGYRNILPWFTKSTEEIEEYTHALEEMGMVMSEEDMETWGKYMADEKMMSMLLTAMQIKIARLVIPALNALMPPLLDVLETIQKVPTPILKFVTGLVALGAALKVAFAVKTMAGNIMEMAGGFARLGRTSSSVTQALPNFVAGLKDAGAASSRYSGLAGTLGGKLRGIATGFMNGVRAAGRWVLKLPSVIAGNVALGASNVALTATYVALAAAIAATAFAVYKAIDAMMQMIDAQKQAIAAGEAGKAAEQAFEAKIAEKYGRGSAEYNRQMQLAGIGTAGTYAQEAKAPWWWGPSSVVTNEIAGYADGGIARAPKTGGLAILHGTERITPLDKERPTVEVRDCTFVGSSKDAAKAITDMVTRNLGRRVGTYERGRFASA